MRVIILIFVAFFTLSVCPIPTTKKEYNLTVKVTGIKGIRGIIEFGLFDDPDKYATVGGTCRQIRKKTTANEVSCTFYNLPEKKYGVCIYHDENSNNKCDKNFFGIPTEGYGFSNNKKPVLSVPTFEECSINLNANKSISIKVLY
jgi:uncharacterized protein (DUF2141 family)